LHQNDENKEFNEVFTDLLYDVIRDAGVPLNARQLEQFQKTCRRSARRMEMKIEQMVMDICRKLQANTKKGFEGVAEDMVKIQGELDSHFNKKQNDYTKLKKDMVPMKKDIKELKAWSHKPVPRIKSTFVPSSERILDPSEK